MADQVSLTLPRDQLEAIAVELGAIRASESRFEMGRPSLAIYNASCNSVRAALQQADSGEGE